MAFIKPNRANTILYCRRWEETVRFYRDVLEMPILFEKGWFVEFMVAKDSYISIADATRTTIAGSGGHGITLSWQVDQLDVLHRRLSDKGVVVSPIKTKWGATVFYFFDPEGHRIEIWSQRAGG